MTAPEPTWEYGFEAPMFGLMYVTTNVLLAETMHAARPEAVLYRRPVTEWARVDQESDDSGEADPGLLLILLGAGVAVLAGAAAIAMVAGVFG